MKCLLDRKNVYYAFFLYFLLSYSPFAKAQVRNDPHLLPKLMSLYGKDLDFVLKNPSKYEVQIIYTQIFRGADGSPTFKEYTYNLNTKRFFQPASLVKLPVVALSLEKMNGLANKGINAYTRMGTGKAHSCQTEVVGNNLSEKNYPCLARYIEKVLLVSDNSAYNRLYEFLGQQHIAQQLKNKGYTQTRIVRRFSDCTEEENRYTNPITFYDPQGKIIHQQAQAYHSQPFQPPYPSSVGYSNYLSMRDVHDMLISLMMPESVSAQKRFNISPQGYQLLWRLLGSFPYEARLNNYSNSGYFNAYKKYFFYGRQPNAIVNKNWRIFNIVGWYGGYVSESAYFIDNKYGVEFFLSAVIKSEAYEKESFPFMKNLGNMIYLYERTVYKNHTPSFQKWLSLWK